MLEASHRYFHRAADLFDLDPKLRSILLTPNRIVKAELAFEGADGELHHHIGYRAQHNNRRGPYKGGLRYHPAMDEDHAVALASLTSDRLRWLRPVVLAFSPAEFFLLAIFGITFIATLLMPTDEPKHRR